MKKTETYTAEQFSALKEWFSGREMPKTMQIDSAAYTDDLAATVKYLFEQAEIYYGNPRMQGSLRLLEKIKRNIEAAS